MSAITGKPQNAIVWSKKQLFTQLNVESVESGLAGVYLFTLKPMFGHPQFPSYLYVGESESCIRRRLRAHYLGPTDKGNRYLHQIRTANPLSVWFQYSKCEDPKNAEAYLIVNLGYPICNARDESPK
ncbi:MAG: hypothetical protein JWO04_3543 [Gammaproteobacteria bacterium]|nr:hypothetical protein [Gammaproteobacteria bacterium]